jgi:hypothetical protein
MSSCISNLSITTTKLYPYLVCDQWEGLCIIFALSALAAREHCYLYHKLVQHLNQKIYGSSRLFWGEKFFQRIPAFTSAPCAMIATVGMNRPI